MRLGTAIAATGPIRLSASVACRRTEIEASPSADSSVLTAISIGSGGADITSVLRRKNQRIVGRA